jgi:hypothetical protein
VKAIIFYPLFGRIEAVQNPYSSRETNLFDKEAQGLLMATPV